MKHSRILLGILSAALLLGMVALMSQDDSSPAVTVLNGRSMADTSAGDTGSTYQQEGISVSEAVAPIKVGPIADLPIHDGEFGLDREINPRMALDPAIVPPKVDEKVDPLLAIQAEAKGLNIPDDFDTPIINQDGQGYTNVNPPDPMGDVGPDHYLQMINSAGGAQITIYNKADGTVAAGPILLDSMAPSGSCTSGLGDPVVLYDGLTSRWLLAEFSSSGNYICMYLSDSDDPVNATWNFYGFQFPSFPDYFKIGVWPDSLFVSINYSGNPAVAAVDWQAMLAGQPAEYVHTTVPPLPAFGFETLTPADRDGFLDVGASSDAGIFMRHRDDEAHSPGTADPNADFLEIWEMTVDWANPGGAAITKVQDIAMSEYSSEMCGFTAFACVPQPSGPQLDPLREPVMWKLHYRNFGSHETLVGNHVTDVDGTDHHGIRWFELRRTGAEWELHQEGTLAPDDDHRFMGAIAMDNSGNIAMLYNVSSSSTFPGVRYIGRLAGDPLGALPQGEYTLVDGSASNSSNRYGDYSALSVDPIDDCTFWGTAEYNTSGQWSTRIGSFRFDACGTPGFYLGADPGELAACVSDSVTSTITVGQVAGFTDPVDLSANNLPTNVTASFNPDPVVPPGSSDLTLDVGAGAAAGNYTIEVVGTTPTMTHSTEIDLTIYSEAPDAPALVAPPDGATDVSRGPTFEWNAAAQAASYQLQVATDAGFTNIVIDESTTETTYQAAGLTPLTTFYWRVRGNNGCGDGAWSEVWSFTTLETPPILLVDDDDNSPDVRPTYVAALTALGLDWDEWDTNNSDNEPTAAELSAYEAVIWFTGDEFGGFAGPGAAGEAALAEWLDGGQGRLLLLSSQDYHYDRGLTPFMTNYLGLSSATNDNGDYSSVTGQTDPFAGLSYTLSYPFSDFSDRVQPGAGEVAFVGNNQQNAALVYEGGDWCTSFWGFPWEAISTTADREEALDAFLSWSCGGGPVATATPTATGPATSIQLSGLESASGGSLPWLLLSLVGIAGLAGVAWLNGRRTR